MIHNLAAVPVSLGLPRRRDHLQTAGKSKALVPAYVAALPGGASVCPRVNTGRVPETGAMLEVCRA